MKENNKALLYVSITVLSWSTVATAFKIALKEFSHYELLLVAATTALIVFAAVITFQSKWHLLKNITGKQWLSYALTGFLNPAFYYLVLFKAYDLLPAQLAQPINYFWPILLTIMLAVFTRQHIPGIKFAGMAVSFVGVVIISLGPGSISGTNFSLTGLLLAFFSAFIWAAFWMLSKKNPRTDNTVNLFVSFLFGVAYLLAGSFFADINLFSFRGMVASIYSGLFEMAIPFIFFGMALRKTSNPTLINQLCYLSPFLSLFLIHFVLGEKIYLTTIIGLILIVAGILFNEYLAKKLSPRHSS
jgi:drug/metabolite transporter (DMT)-like permease